MILLDLLENFFIMWFILACINESLKQKKNILIFILFFAGAISIQRIGTLCSSVSPFLFMGLGVLFYSVIISIGHKINIFKCICTSFGCMVAIVLIDALSIYSINIIASSYFEYFSTTWWIKGLWSIPFRSMFLFIIFFINFRRCANGN